MTQHRWSNWAGLVHADPLSIEAPTSTAEVAALVVAAAARNESVRVAGSGHSFAPLVPTDGRLLVMENLVGVSDAAEDDAHLCQIGAGTTIRALGPLLAKRGLALANQGDIDSQTIAGATGTGTHGTGPALPSLSAAVVGMTLVDGRGTVHTVNSADAAIPIEAAALSLGALGVVCSITMRCVEAYRLAEATWIEPTAACLSLLDERVAATRHYEFFWVPEADVCLNKSLDPTTDEPHQLVVEQKVRRRVGPSHEIFPTERTDLFDELEYAVPAEAGPAAFAELRTLVRERHPHVTWPIEYRTLAPDDRWLGPAGGRPTVTLSVHDAAGSDHTAFFADAEAILGAHDGRPHWGKRHTRTAEQLRADYPRFDNFWDLADRLDPQHLFRNPHLDGLSGRSNSREA